MGVEKTQTLKTPKYLGRKKERARGRVSLARFVPR